jgi:hypothetical protein
MTAEIAILNRTAVALAADSIVTLAGGLRPKTYDSAEKIFELSRFQPIALMIYNNAQFMNAPLEVIIRKYREQLTTNEFKELVQVWPAFQTYLLAFKHEPEDEFEHFRGMVLGEVRKLHTMTVTFMLESLGRRRRKRGETPEEFVVRRCHERQAEAENSPLEGEPFGDVTIERFTAAYGAIVDEIAGRGLTVDYTEELRTALHSMMFALIRSDVQTPAFTGLVFAGFGVDELFPTLHAVEIDGVYFGRFRVLTSHLVDIDRRGETAAVVPFAQKDMPERFMLGIDKEFEGALDEIAQSLVGQIVDQNSRAFRNGLGEKVKAAAAKQFRDGIDRLKKKNLNNLRSVVNHLSKKELGEVAYSLVELTSRKRRYSSDMETVGGPIDVAILTRNEGFIWVRRKHYFEADLNPRYMQRLRS